MIVSWRSNLFLVRLLLFRIDIVSLFVHRHAIAVSRHRHRSSSCIDTAVTTYLVFFVLDILDRTFRRRRNLRIV